MPNSLAHAETDCVLPEYVISFDIRKLYYAALLLLLPGTAFSYSYTWDYTGAVDRFEMKLDAGAYVSVGLPPVASGKWTLLGDPTLTGTHSAVVRACSAGICTPDSNVLNFTVAPAPKPVAPVNLRLILPPTESPSGTNLTLAGVGSIIDSIGAVWTLGPKNPTIDGGVYPTKARNGVIDGSAAVLCYSGRAVNARGDLAGGWWKWTDNAALAAKGSWSLVSAPVGCL